MQDIGSKYKTQIPSLTENADIQTALRVYHYGAASEPGSLVPNSVAGHLETLENTKVDIVPIQITAGSSNNLNLKNVTGYYSISTDAIAAAGTNYPPSATAGMLHVMNDGSGIIYQTYIMSGAQPKMVWRGYYAGAWSSWIQASASDHSHAEFNTLATAINTKQATIVNTAAIYPGVNASFDSEKVVVTNSSGQLAASSSITTTELGYLDGVTSSIQTQANQKPTTYNASGPITGVKVYIQSTTPTGASTGDIWFW